MLDASAAIEAVHSRAHSSSILEMLHGATVVIAPDLYASEVSNVLWKYVVAREIDALTAAEDLDACLGFVDRFVPAADLAQEALREAISHKHPVYDLVYAITARREGCTVVTIDARLRKLLSSMRIPTAGV